jgi:hypothetical protein
MNLVLCRYNPSHKMKVGKLLMHEDKCPDRHSKVLKMCPYNPLHKISPDNYENHKRICSNRPIIDKELQSDLKEFLNIKETANLNSTTSMTKRATSSLNYTAESNHEEDINDAYRNIDFNRGNNTQKQMRINTPVAQTIGIGNDKTKSKQIKKERKKKEKEYLKAIDNFNDEGTTIQANQEGDDIIQDINEKFANSELSEDEGNNLSDNDLEIGEDFENLDQDINYYDPNESDLRIGRENKNCFNMNNKDDDSNFDISQNESGTLQDINKKYQNNKKDNSNTLNRKIKREQEEDDFSSLYKEISALKK